MKQIRLSTANARRFLIHYQGLDDSFQFAEEAGVRTFLRRVGCIQYDPLHVVGRNPDLVLQARIHDYQPALLQKMLYTDRTLIDGWDKMMAIYTREDWPAFHHLRRVRTASLERTLEHRQSLEALNWLDHVRDAIAQRGPLLASQLDFGETEPGRWGHRKLASVAMDYLFHAGKLGISAKKNTQKIYDLIENLLPLEILQAPQPFQDEDEFCKWYIKRRIGSVGLLRSTAGSNLFGSFPDKATRSKILAELVEEQQILPVTIEDVKDTYLIRKEDKPLLDALPEQPAPVMKVLAPLDNLLWDRDMIEQLFGFRYSWEVYLPKQKRKFGYYVLPVLYGDRLVGRFEPEKHRGHAPLQIKSWWWEDLNVTEAMRNSAQQCLQQFARYLSADGVECPPF